MSTWTKQEEGKTRDLNRFRKVYRYIRKKPKLDQCHGPLVVVEFPWERGIITFENQDNKTHDFITCFTSTPVVIATPADSGPDEMNVEMFVTDITTESAKFRSSAPFTGKVHFQAISPGVYNMANTGKKVEVVELDFGGSPGTTKTHTWDNSTETFSCTPVVSATASEDVNVFITAVSTSEVTIEVSQNNYAGKVYLIGIERGC